MVEEGLLDELVHGVIVCDGAAGSAVFALYDGVLGAVEGPDTAAETLADAVRNDETCTYV